MVGTLPISGWYVHAALVPAERQIWVKVSRSIGPGPAGMTLRKSSEPYTSTGERRQPTNPSIPLVQKRHLLPLSSFFCSICNAISWVDCCKFPSPCLLGHPLISVSSWFALKCFRTRRISTSFYRSPYGYSGCFLGATLSLQAFLVYFYFIDFTLNFILICHKPKTDDSFLNSNFCCRNLWKSRISWPLDFVAIYSLTKLNFSNSFFSRVLLDLFRASPEFWFFNYQLTG